MFAPAKKKLPTKKEGPATRKPVFNNNRLMVVNKEINKTSSIRTFQPFVHCPSSSGKNSFQRSLMGSEENYEGLLNEEENQE